MPVLYADIAESLLIVLGWSRCLCLSGRRSALGSRGRLMRSSFPGLPELGGRAGGSTLYETLCGNLKL